MSRDPVRFIVGAFCVAWLVQGCASPSLDAMRHVRYRPDAAGRVPALWRESGETGETGGMASSDGQDARRSEEGVTARTLKRGGRVSIYLRGIPSPEEVIDVIDDLGGVNLPLIGRVEIAGLTSSEAEDKIDRLYVESGFYRRITINVNAEREEYFIRGEVKKSGAYEIAGDLSLLRAITAAGGYTDYAKPEKIKVIREGREAMEFNAALIEKGQRPDPLIEPGDIIIVPRRWFW